MRSSISAISAVRKTANTLRVCSGGFRVMVDERWIECGIGHLTFFALVLREYTTYYDSETYEPLQGAQVVLL